MSEERNSLRILYIEDNRDNRILVKRVLEAEGYQVLEAANGPAGIELAQKEYPALILVDINMPDMDGYEVTRRLRAIQEFRDVPIIALTAKVMKGDRERTLEAGCSGYIQKPIDVDLLPAQVAAHLHDKRRFAGGLVIP
jgi:two-component system cell cycle response regulator DivK